MYFEEYVFNQTMKHVNSFVVNLPITFPFLIIGIILKQHRNIVHAEEMKNMKPLPLTLGKKPFVGRHVPETMVKHQGQTPGGSSSLVSKATKKDVLLELIEVSKSMQETISASTTKKKKVDELIKILNKERETDEKTYDSEEKEEEQSVGDGEVRSS